MFSQRPRPLCYREHTHRVGIHRAYSKVSGRIACRPVVGSDGTAHGEEQSSSRSSPGVREGYNPRTKARNRKGWRTAALKPLDFQSKRSVTDSKCTTLPLTLQQNEQRFSLYHQHLPLNILSSCLLFSLSYRVIGKLQSTGQAARAARRVIKDLADSL